MAALSMALAFGTASLAGESGAGIYQDGRGDGPAIQARLANGQLRFPATSLRCASCHGVDGAGKREGANRVPPVTWQALAAPRSESAEWTARPVYDDALLLRAVIDGVDSAGRTLSTAMPRYALSQPQGTALAAYLKELGRGDTNDVGISPNLIHIGAALPLSGPDGATGNTIQHLIAGILARESVTGLYGRRLELAVADTEAHGAQAALRQLVEKDHVFALIASRLSPDAGDLDPDIPVIGNFDGAANVSSHRIFRIAAPIADRVAVLLWQAEACEGPNLRIAVIGQADAEGRAALDAPAHAAIHNVLDWRDLARPDAAVAAASIAGAEAILMLAPRDTIMAVQRAMLEKGMTVPLLIPGQPNDDAVAGATIGLSPSGRQHVRLAFAGLSPDQVDESGFRTVTEAGVGDEERSLLVYAAYASVVVFLEAVKQAGRRLDRAALVEALEKLHDVRTGVMPPIGFGPNRHDGLSGAAVVSFTADGRPKFLLPWQSAESSSHQATACYTGSPKG